MANPPVNRAYTLHCRNKPRAHLPCTMHLRLSRVPCFHLGNTFPRKRFKPEDKVHILQQYILISQSRNRRHYEAAYKVILALYPQICSCHCWKMKTNIFSWRNNQSHIITDLPGRTSKTSREKGSLATRPQRSLLLNIKIKTLIAEDSTRAFRNSCTLHIS